jgi:hypothetical protein
VVFVILTSFLMSVLDEKFILFIFKASYAMDAVLTDWHIFGLSQSLGTAMAAAINSEDVAITGIEVFQSEFLWPHVIAMGRELVG